MLVKVTTEEEIVTFGNVWEVQDNGHEELVLKFHTHECIRIKEDSIIKVEVEL